jgi:hypothetical protein
MTVFGLNGGELFIVAFVTIMVVSARYWPALGGRLAVRLAGAKGPSASAPARGAPPPPPAQD